MPSVTTGAVGRRRFLRGVAMPSTCTSTTAFSPEWPVKRPVGALRDLQEHPEGVLLGFSPPNLEPGLPGEKIRPRPCAHPPEALRAWAHRPAILRIAAYSAPSSAKISPWRAHACGSPPKLQLARLYPRTAVSKRRTADATPRRRAATFASLTSDLRWRRPLSKNSHCPRASEILFKRKTCV